MISVWTLMDGFHNFRLPFTRCKPRCLPASSKRYPFLTTLYMHHNTVLKNNTYVHHNIKYCFKYSYMYIVHNPLSWGLVIFVSITLHTSQLISAEEYCRILFSTFLFISINTALNLKNFGCLGFRIAAHGKKKCSASRLWSFWCGFRNNRKKCML